MPLDAETEEMVAELIDPASPEAMEQQAAGVQIAGRVTQRLARVWARTGQTLTLTDTATSDTFDFVGQVRVLLFQEMAAHFTQIETATWARPAYKIQVAGDFRTTVSGPAIGDTITLPDGIHTVRKVDRTYIADVAYRTILYVARNAV